MERRKSGGEDKGSGLTNEDMLHPHTTKLNGGRMSDLEKVVLALLIVGLLGIGGVIFKASRASMSDD